MSTFPVTQAFYLGGSRPRWQPSRVLEAAAAAVLLALVSPVLAVAAAVVWALCGRAPFVAHRRVGLQGAPLWVFKLRTMWDAPARAPFHLIEYLRGDRIGIPKTKSDPRITSRFAAFCRRYSIDELPQLWQVVSGDLSFVGPRPITSREMARYYANAREVLSVKPGLTGLWQINGRGCLGYRQRRRLDLLLVRRFSPALYLAILLRTPLKVLSGRGAW